MYVTDNEDVPAELGQKIRQQTKKLNVYALHKKQYAAGRQKVTEREASLSHGEALIFRDYVNHHDLTGRKISYLHWVILYGGGPFPEDI